MARQLKEGIAALQATTSAALGILALASGIYTYIGVRGLLDGTGGITALAAIAYSAAVSVGIYVFWTYVLRFFPLLRAPAARMQMVLAILLGSAAIVAMSSWLNAAALAGSAAVEQHLAETVEDYQEALERSQEQALAALGLLPDIRIAAANFENLAEQERGQGALTGTSGSGTVVQLLLQMSSQLRELEAQIVSSRADVESLFGQGSQHLREMRELVAQPGPVEARSIEFAEEAVQVAGLVTQLKQSSIAPAVLRAAEDLARSYVAPALDGGSAALRAQQQRVVENVRETIQQQSRALAAGAQQVLATPAVELPRFTPISTAEAVLLYAGDFVPSWAGAIAIDLLPGVIVMILVVVQGAIRREEEPFAAEDIITLREMQAAMLALKRIEAVQAGMRPAMAAESPEGAPAGGAADAAPGTPEAAAAGDEPGRRGPKAVA
ncbi:MAG: hypothetical protein RIB84_15055 [Sneathiellaceae bacterium]